MIIAAGSHALAADHLRARCLLLLRDAQTVEALESNGHVELGLVPNVHGAHALLLVEVFCLVVDEHASDISVLAKEFGLPQDVLSAKSARPD